MKHQASCHCQNIRIEFEADLKEVMSCNCSICARRGHLLTFVGEGDFKQLTDSKFISDYQWGKKTIHFHFCSNCGCAPFGRGVGPNGPMVAVNVRCMEYDEWKNLPVVEYDGKHAL